jgi:eukaryotic-like serine/threonine-protein kinase
MKSPPEPPDAIVLAGMEGLIAAMRGQRLAPLATEPRLELPPTVGNDDERAAAAAWRAMHVSWPDASIGAQGTAAGGWTYLERGDLVGRYVVLRELGAGGMGVVYAAYDPELDRKVALKLVRSGNAGGDGWTRLLREAQALAKLSHRNVVGIHDVGTMGEQVWLAMELVQGLTLREWLKQPRPWGDVLGVMRKAGRELAAAHAGGLLHRDFKPENVMVDERGRVRVMDFGLACARPNAVPLAADESTLEVVPVVDTLALRVTQAGTLLGTPLYMAPEQFLGRELTPAVDQFSLCVTLWEGLHGVRPFAGTTLDELVDNMLAGRLQEPTKGQKVPRWLRRVCERGLAVEPEQRWPSMEALLETLAKGRTRARVRKGSLAVRLLALLGVGVEGHRRYDLAQRTAACEASGDEIQRAWSPAREQQLREALVGTGVSYAATTADKTMPWLERQAEAWREARVETCLDANVRGRWDVEMLDRSLWCLDERRTELGSLVDELTRGDAEVLQKAATAAVGLSSVIPCRDPRLLEASALPPEEAREAIREVRAMVTRAANLERAGRYDLGLELVGQALERAEELQWRPLAAAVRLRLGSLLEKKGSYAAAEAAFEDAYFEGTEGMAPEVAVDAASKLVWTVGYELARPVDGRRWGRLAEVALTSLQGDQELRRAGLLDHLGVLHQEAGNHDQARALHEQALSIPPWPPASQTLPSSKSPPARTTKPRCCSSERSPSKNRRSGFTTPPSLAPSTTSPPFTTQSEPTAKPRHATSGPSPSKRRHSTPTTPTWPRISTTSPSSTRPLDPTTKQRDAWSEPSPSIPMRSAPTTPRRLPPAWPSPRSRSRNNTRPMPCRAAGGNPDRLPCVQLVLRSAWWGSGC